MKPVKKRVYQSPRRQQQAQQTRSRIVACARELFLSTGFAATTIDAIATRAGVAAPTVYAVFGSKQGILFALLDDMAGRADPAALAAELQAAAGQPLRQLEAGIAFNVRFYADSIELISLVRTVSGVDPDLVAMWNEGEARRRKAQSRLAAEWERAGSLARGVTARRATDLLWAMSGPDVYRLFVVENGWSRQELQEWLIATLARQILRPGR